MIQCCGTRPCLLPPKGWQHTHAMRQVLIIVAVAVTAVTGVVLLFTHVQVRTESDVLARDLEQRTRILAESLQESVEPAYIVQSQSALQRIVERFANRQPLVGVAVVDRAGTVVAASEHVSEAGVVGVVPTVSALQGESGGSFLRTAEATMYVYAVPLTDETGEVTAAMVVVQDASYIDERAYSTWWNNIARLLAYVLLFGAAVALLVRWVVLRPLMALAATVKSARTGRGGLKALEPLKQNLFFMPLAREISEMTKSLGQARHAASEEARLRLQKIDTPWTAERLKEFIRTYLKGRPIYVVSNREPYAHTRRGNEILWSVPASGMVTALEPVMAAAGGMWIAHGGGDADREVTDESGKVAVPPDDPKYTLKRIWLEPEEIKGHYDGFSNEALWPLCHTAHTRPIFRNEDWAMYKRVNGKFAEQILSELKDVQRPIILIQDYHFALLPQMLKDARPDAQIGIFWHIPWPSPEAFSICPWRKELLEGMLGADIVGFHTQQYCNNFLDTVGKEIESLIDFEQFAVTRDDHVSYIKPFPISIAFTNGAERDEADKPDKKVLSVLGIKTERFGLGVDRMDYTKGILERFKAIEFLLEKHTKYREKFTFLQIAPPSREGVEKYREYGAAVKQEADRINKRFGKNGWRPIVLETRHYTHSELEPLYRLADVCVVTSLHDGMNLVAKEFVAARDDESGVLVLSQFTGAARTLKGALLVNPYSAEETAEAVHKALSMSPTEQYRRMRAMRNTIKDYNVYRWSAELIKAVASIA
ncbi:trehalose-6-phosphate synthase [Candidatus Kaiserbacteria bacterium CG10_big_fil_rev_8_21_14_0_10_59_10]|uniref:Trehalose-6-phosphate synthase n=1 Tax=Candidatus Kaiserbacteria bacterium CG10_big_fil_rev_8_21_14_0_10_59_10 TaxID=1974612 RepID=A0A2H0U6Y6_9BACT|nr:MAG: trehalose-6-phosphate synthase [Candidatus Kaiserbacteria bacterium CG10_big_fil_rev_8_21_14_0_10_59_10]